MVGLLPYLPYRMHWLWFKGILLIATHTSVVIVLLKRVANIAYLNLLVKLSLCKYHIGGIVISAITLEKCNPQVITVYSAFSVIQTLLPGGYSNKFEYLHEIVLNATINNTITPFLYL